ncbi:MAG TPA: TIM barrel protein [Abditibacteriaceae bacterium]|jgi:sugar phosphate isomerase/epimerase
MKLGISSYTFGWAVGVRGHEPPEPLDEIGLLQKAHEFGVSLLQIGDNLPLETFDQLRLQNLAQEAAKNGIELEVGARNLTLERLYLYCEICRNVGASLLRFVIDDEDYHPAPEEVIPLLQEAARHLERYGITLGIENHDRFAARNLREMIVSANSDFIGVCLDTANSLGAGEGLNEIVPLLAPYTVNLHAKDFTIARHAHKMGFVVNGAPAGAGMMNLPLVLEALEPYHRCRSLILELWTSPEDSLEATIEKEAQWARQSIDYLKSLPIKKQPVI